jgi:hypothetical protein
MNDDEIKKNIVQFIEVRLRFRIDSNTVLFKDLKLIGDDADAFMSEFSDVFNVNYDKMVFGDYFVEESSIPFLYLYRKYFNKVKLKRKEFKLDHLVEVVKKGEWFEPRFNL